MVSSVVTSALIQTTGYYVNTVSNVTDQMYTNFLGPIYAARPNRWCRRHGPSDDYRLEHNYDSVGSIHGTCWMGHWDGREYTLYCYPSSHGKVSLVPK